MNQIARGAKAPKGKTLIKIEVPETEVIKHDPTNASVYSTKKVGSIYVASSVKRDYAGHFDPINGEVMTGEHAGKTAWFVKNSYAEAKFYGNTNKLFKAEEIDMPEGSYIMLDDLNIIFYTTGIYNSDSTNGESVKYDHPYQIEMVKNWCLCEPVSDTDYEYVDGVRVKCRKTNGGLIIPVQNEDYKTDIAILRHIHPEPAEEFGLSVGDTVYIDRACDLPVEDNLNQQLGKLYFRVEIGNILGIKTE